LDACLAELAERRQVIDGKTAEADALDARAHEDDARLAELDEAVRACERRIAENRQQIAAAEALMQHERARSVDLDEELSRGRKQLAALSIRSGDLDHQLHETSAAVRAAEERHREGAVRLATDEQAFQQLKAEIDAARAANDARQGRLREQLRQAARLAGDIRSLESQRTAAAERTERIETRRAALDTSRQDLHAQLDRLGSQEHELAEAINEETRQLEAVQHRLAERRERRTSVQEELTRLCGRAAAANERATVIEELEERHEGLGPGVRQILAGARAARNLADAQRHEPGKETAGKEIGKETPPNPLLAVRGLVADLLQVNVETAPLVETALGELASHVAIASGSDLFRLIASGELPLGGRVGFLPLDAAAAVAPQPWSGDEPAQAVHPLEKTPGVIAAGTAVCPRTPGLCHLGG
jgi:chromosome segregation protein